MIIFYNLKTGNIVGTIEGRIHHESHLKMFIGDKKENGKIVCQWKVSKRWENKKGEKFVEYEPNHSQKDIFINIDKKPASIYNYKINLKTKELLPIPEPENPKMQSSDK